MDESEYESSMSSCDEEDERLRPLPSLVATTPRPVIDVGTRITGDTVPSKSMSYSSVAPNIVGESTTPSASSDQPITTNAAVEESPEINSTPFHDFLSVKNVSAVDIDPAVILYSKPFMKDASCQTVVTGDVLSLNFYQGDGCMTDREWTSFNDILDLLLRIGNSNLYT